MVERQTLVVRRRRFGNRLGPLDAIAPTDSALGGQGAGHVDHAPYRGQLRKQRIDLLRTVVQLAVIAVAVGCQQQAGFDLPQAIQHHRGAHVRGTSGPDRTDAGAGEEGHDRLGSVGQTACDPISGSTDQRHRSW